MLKDCLAQLQKGAKHKENAHIAEMQLRYTLQISNPAADICLMEGLKSLQVQKAIPSLASLPEVLQYPPKEATKWCKEEERPNEECIC